MMTDIFFTSQRLIGRSLDLADLDAVVGYRSDPHVFKFQDWTSFNVENGLELIKGNMRSMLGSPGWYQIGTERKEDSILIGDIGFRIFETDAHLAQIGYTFGKAHWGQGYATEAVRATIHHAFEQLNVECIIASAHPENAPSHNVLQKAGFIRVDETFDGLWPGDIVYALRKN